MNWSRICSVLFLVVIVSLFLFQCGNSQVCYKSESYTGCINSQSTPYYTTTSYKCGWWKRCYRQKKLYSYACVQYGTLYRTRAICCPGAGSCIGGPNQP